MKKNLELDEKHVASKKKVGTKNGNPIWQITTTGGLYVLAAAEKGAFNIVATGPHPAIARHIAESKLTGVNWTGLSKSDFIPLCDYEHMLPEFEELTNRFIKLQKKK